jgi:endonuclease/exonuclease/phosphatase family metal-dependent hydrolase
VNAAGSARRTRIGAYTSPAVGLVIRSWNIFHGRAHPPDSTLRVEEAIRLATADRPDVLCLQEVPPWALDRLEGWSGLQAFGEVAARPSLGPPPIPAELGRRLTDLEPALFRAAFSGQANAILVSPQLRTLEERTLVLNDGRFRKRETRRLGLDLVTRLAWAKERRVCQAVRLVLPDSRHALVANFHASSTPGDTRIADAEVMRAACFADALAEPDDLLVLAGDFNAESGQSEALAELCRPEWGFSDPGPGIDHILVRGTGSSPATVWPLDRRSVNGIVLSDHAPVELTIE